MKYLNIATLFIVGVIAYMLYRFMKAQQVQNELLVGIAVKNGIIDAPKNTKVLPDRSGVLPVEGKRGDPKKKLNAMQKKVVDLFSDGLPKKIGDLKKIWIAKHGNIETKEEDVKFNNTLYNLKPCFWLNFEKIDGVNFWGLDEWFDEDSNLFEEYAEKIGVKDKSEGADEQ